MELVGLFKVINRLVDDQWGPVDFDFETWHAVRSMCRRGRELAGSNLRNPSSCDIRGVRELMGVADDDTDA